MTPKQMLYWGSGLLGLIWVGIGLYTFVDWEALFETPEDVIMTFQTAATDFDFERAWGKLSLRMQHEVYGEKSAFIDQFFGQGRIRRDVALAQIQSIDELEGDIMKVMLRNWFLNDYVIVMVIKDGSRGWKIDYLQTNVVL